MSEVHHQPSFAADMFNLWRLPFELAAESVLAFVDLVAQSHGRHEPHMMQLPIPDVLEEAGEHNLFA